MTETVTGQENNARSSRSWSPLLPVSLRIYCGPDEADWEPDGSSTRKQRNRTGYSASTSPRVGWAARSGERQVNSK